MDYFADYLPITTGNRLRLYLDGRDYCGDLAASLRAARRFVFLTGLHFMADFGLIRTGKPGDLRHMLAPILADAARRGVEVFLLVNQFWADEQELNRGKRAPIRHKIMKSGELYGYLPETFKLFELLEGSPRIHCRTDIHPNSDIFATNHQKTVVIDDRIAYLGGIDLTYLDGDRWDTGEHDGRYRHTDRTQRFWHDVHMRVEGPAVEFVRDNFAQRWQHGDLGRLSTNAGGDRVIRADQRPAPLPKNRSSRPSTFRYPTGQETPDVQTVQIVRSMPQKDTWHREKPVWNRSKADWERSCKDAYLIGIRAARKYIYLENQWIADEDIWAELATAAKRNQHDPEFRIILMVPYLGLFAAGLGSNQELWVGAEMEKVIKNSHSAGTFGMYSLYAPPRPGGPYGQIYVHSKILIVDDEWSLIGSANAGGISLEGIRSGRDEPDTELSAIILDRTFATGFRRKLWQEHLRRPVSATYRAKDADHFRLLAGRRQRSRVKFFPDYDKIKRGFPTWSPIVPRPDRFPIGQYRKSSRIVASYPDDLARAGVPPTLFRASFRAHLLPEVPPGYRAWYRWRCDLFYDPTTGKADQHYRMRSLVRDTDDVFEYTDQDAVYIGRATAEAIDRQLRDVATGRILCRVQIIPVVESPDSINVNFPTLLLEHEVQFMNASFARSNHPNFYQFLPAGRRNRAR
jgi:phosphatidylserine/phosphatidylglycerophosphate/cardiolipin synthase-like enzyme